MIKLYTGFKALKDKADCSFADVASKCGVSEQAVRNWYAGTALPYTKYLPKLSEFFNIDLSLLVNTLLYVDTSKHLERNASQ